MMVRLKYVILFLITCLLLSCNISKKNQFIHELISEDENYEYCDDNSEEQIHESTLDNLSQIKLTGIMETCNKCMGYGMVQNGLYGTLQVCKFCWISTWMLIQQGWTCFNGRYGVVDAVFNKLPANYFDELDMSGQDETHSNGEMVRNQIENEIERCEQNVVEMEHQLEYVEGSVYRTYLQQQITAERIKIRQLKEVLDRLE